MHKITILVTAIGLLFALSNCDNGQTWKKEYADLLRQEIDLEHRHCLLKASIDSLWDITSTRLEQALPSDFPAKDREIFIKARNANHIKMFMSFGQLDSNTQSLVNDAGKYDEMLAAQVRSLLEQKQGFEQQKMQFLQKVEQKDGNASRTYANEFRAATTDVCR